MRTFTTIAIAAAVAAATLGTALAAATQDAAPAAAAKATEGKVTGKVKFDGKAPEMKPLEVTDEKAKGCCPEGKKVDMTDPSLTISKDGGLANVVVTIDVPGATAEPSKDEIHMDQKMCRFEPHVRVVPAGSKVVFLNSDQVSHNVHTYANKNDPWNKTIAPGFKEEQTMTKGDKIQIKCDIHTWMSAWVYVTETPYAAVTGEDGSFTISGPGLKPGKYKVELWHEKLGKQKAEVTIKDDGTCEPLDLKMGEKKKEAKEKK